MFSTATYITAQEAVNYGMVDEIQAVKIPKGTPILSPNKGRREDGTLQSVDAPFLGHTTALAAVRKARRKSARIAENPKNPRELSMTAEAPIHEGQVLSGPLFNEPMRVKTVHARGTGLWEAGLVGQHSEQFRQVTLTASDISNLTIADAAFSYGGDGRRLRIGLQAYALGIAYEFDPYFRIVRLARRPAAAPARGRLRAPPQAAERTLPAR